MARMNRPGGMEKHEPTTRKGDRRGEVCMVRESNQKADCRACRGHIVHGVFRMRR